MSKKHRHKHDFDERQRYFGIITEEELIILIAIILIFGDRNNHGYEHINYKKPRNEGENIKSYSFQEPVFTMESGVSNEHIEPIDSNFIEAAECESNENTVQELPEENPIILDSKVKVCNTATLQCCSNDNIEDYISVEPVVSKIPVIISQPELQIFIETLTAFPEPVFEIKAIDKQVFLNQCQLVVGSDKLFIKGFIQENVEYATSDCIEEDSINGSIKKVSFNIPFQCSAKVFFNIKPIISVPSYTLDLEVLNHKRNAIDLNKKSFEHFEFLNEKVYAELDSIKILETHIKEDIEPLENTIESAYIFEKMRKKIILNLKLNLLQNQSIFIFDSPEEDEYN